MSLHYQLNLLESSAFGNNAPMLPLLLIKIIKPADLD